LLEVLGESPWVRMHSLLREHCLARLARDDPARLGTLRQRAAQALASRGELDEATELALDAAAWSQALGLIAQQAEQLTARGAWGTLASWLARLPREVIQETPPLALLEVRVAVQRMRLAEAHALLDRLDAARLAPGDRAHALLYRAAAFRHARRLDDARRELRRARTLIDEHEATDSVLRIEADFEEGATLGMAGDVLPSIRLLRRAAEAAETRGSARLAAESYQNLGLALQFAGQLGAAQEAMREAMRRWEYLGERELRLLALNNEATAAQALGDLDAAAAEYSEVAKQAEALGLPRLRALGQLGLADVARDRGEIEVADRYYRDASRIAREVDHAGVEAAAAFGRAMALRERGALAEARTMLEHHLQVAREQGTGEFATRFRIGLAGVLLSEGRPYEAHAALREVLEAPGGGLQRRQLALLMRAAAEFRLGRAPDVEGTLIELQGLVEELGYDQFMVAEARLCADLLTNEHVTALPGGYYAGLLRRAQPQPVLTPGVQERATEGRPDFVVRALGKLTVTRPGDARSDLQWRGQRSKELFLFLLVSGRPVSREEVDAALWPEAPPSRLASLFHSALHRLRRAMGQETVLHDRGGYDLNPALALDYDVRVFEELLADAERAGNDEERARALQAAVATYRGEFAPRVDSPWVEATRERLAQRYVGARLALAALALAGDRFAEAVAHAEAALDADAVSDEAARHLIAAHVGAGHPDLALRAYRKLQDLFEQDSRAVPSSDTLRALARARGEGPSQI
jgi:DNA-binding SARP family transcriptional activator